MKQRSTRFLSTAAVLALVAGLLSPVRGRAIGEASHVDIRGIDLGHPETRPTARARLAWAVRQRTSVETRLTPTRTRLDDPELFGAPFLFIGGDRAFANPSETEVAGLRRFVELGGFVLIDDASAGNDGFDQSVRALMRRAFPSMPLRPVPATHTIFRSFYLVNRPVGRVEGPTFVEAIERDARLVVVYSRHDLAGAYERDNLGSHTFDVTPGGERQREMAVRFGVNLVMYALCLDYKDDQVHAPFIMRRRGPTP